MKRMKALGVVEWHLTRRQAIYYLLSIGMPTAFYLFFSGMYQDTPGAPAHFMRDYLLSMTAFSMMSTALFSFPTVLETDRLNNWQKVLRLSLIHILCIIYSVKLFPYLKNIYSYFIKLISRYSSEKP